MALPKLEKAAIELASTQECYSYGCKSRNAKTCSSLYNKQVADGLKATAQAVIGNVPAMIKDITDELKSGPVDNFAIAINKLVKLTNELGIDLREYNKDLADTVDRFKIDK